MLNIYAETERGGWGEREKNEGLTQYKVRSDQIRSIIKNLQHIFNLNTTESLIFILFHYQLTAWLRITTFLLSFANIAKYIFRQRF